MDEIALREYLQGTPVRALFYYESVGSTNSAALEMIQQQTQVQDWSLHYAYRQTSGRGRLERKWSMQPEAGLAFSLLLLPHLQEVRHLSLFSPLAALAVCNALEKMTDLQPQIKWPNDVLINRKKVSGILVEANWTGAICDGLVMGIGINLSPAAIPPDDMLSFPATSVESEAGKSVNRFELLRQIIYALDDWRPLLGSDFFYQNWTERLAFRGERVRLDQSGKPPICGIFTGIDPEGNLLIEADGGRVRSFSAGDLRLRLEE